MLQPSYTRQFEKDLKRLQKRGKPIAKIKKIIGHLINKIQLDQKYGDHKLVVNYHDRRECHIEPNWLLIYKKTKQEIIFERTGTHSDLFQ